MYSLRILSDTILKDFLLADSYQEVLVWASNPPSVLVMKTVYECYSSTACENVPKAVYDHFVLLKVLVKAPSTS